ncbi:MAG: class I SAM-dependent methyltransferase [Candidatus Woesearchaeota archaeon]
MFKQFLINPKATGSVFSSSKTLVSKLTQDIDFNAKVIELGPGTGCVTSQILQRVSENDLVAYELQREYANHIRTKFNISVYNKSAEHLNEIENFNPNYIISSIPFTLLHQKTITKILQSSYDVLKNKGTFKAYLYTLNPWIKRKQYFETELERIYGQKPQKQIVWKNFPPATIYTIRKQ